MHDQLRELPNKQQHIGNVRGLGMIQGVELVKDRYTKEPASTDAAKVSCRAFELSLLMFCAGMFSNVLEITPLLF